MLEPISNHINTTILNPARKKLWTLGQVPVSFYCTQENP